MSDRQLTLATRLAYPGFDLAVDETVPLSGVTALFGPSGGGKSTLLRILAGFEQATGRVVFDGDPWLDSDRKRFVPAHRRPVGFMFQDTRLFAHLTVAGNLRYAERRGGGSGGPADQGFAFDDVVAALDLAPLLGRRIGALSGGERQRVALGRTLLTRPRLLLLDEPLSALDAERKADILPYLEDVPRRFGVPAIYVTHSVEEVARLAQAMIVMAGGRIHAIGPTGEIMQRLDLEPLTGRFEAGVVVEARVAGHDRPYHLTRLDLGGQSLTVPMLGDLPAGRTVRLRIRARDVALSTAQPSGLSVQNILSGTLAEIRTAPASAFAEALIDLGHARLRARITRKAVDDLALAPGAPVYALVKSVTFDPGGE